MKKIACYIRVSTTSQKEVSQKREVQRWLEGNGIDVESVVWFVDKATGDNLDRPGFENLQSAIFHGEVGTVVIYKLDRLSRSLADGIKTLTDWLERGVRVVSTTQQLDFAGATGKLVAAVLLGIGEMEQETRRERQAAGIAAARERGVYKGRKPGSTKGDIGRMASLRAKGRTDSEIAAIVGVSRQTVWRCLKA